MPKKNKQAAINNLAQILTKLVYIFRRGGKANDFKWWNESSSRSIFYPMYGYEDGSELYEQVVQGILSLNPDMLSEYEVNRKLMFDFLEDQTISVNQGQHLNDQKLIDEAVSLLNKLVEFKAWQDVDIPIANLWLEGEPAKLGKVTFMGVTKEEHEQWKEQGMWSEKSPDFGVVARVKAPGDEQKAISYTITHVNLALDVLRAFCFPFGRYNDTWRVGLVGDIISWTFTLMRINNRHFVTLLGPGIARNELRKHILSKLEQPQWTLIDKLIQKIHPSKMEMKLFDCIHWLAEATKPDSNRAKFAKISIALEALLGGEPKDEELKVRGITAMLVERVAFIAGKDLDERQSIDKDIRKFYRMRSGIVHGSEGEVSLDDIDNFGQIVRHLALSMLDKIDKLGDEISTVDRLENWIKVQRYSLPEDSKKEVL